MKRTYNKWTSEEVFLLKSCYKTMDYKQIAALLPNHSISSVQRQLWKVHDLPKPPPRKSNPEKLLLNTPEAFYWIGFLLADGNFSERRLSVTYHIKDKAHLEKLKKFANSTNQSFKADKTSLCERLHMTNVKIIQELRNKFDIKNNKTKFPPDMSKYNFSDDLFFALIIGYFDGDGCICKRNNNYSLGIVSDQSWNDNFILIFEFLHRYFNENITTLKPKITQNSRCLPQDITKTKKLYYQTNIYITRKYFLQKIKNKANELNIPFMNRKLGQLI